MGSPDMYKSAVAPARVPGIAGRTVAVCDLLAWFSAWYSANIDTTLPYECEDEDMFRTVFHKLGFKRCTTSARHQSDRKRRTASAGRQPGIQFPPAEELMPMLVKMRVD